MEFLRHTLPNGLEVIAERNEKAYCTALGFFVKTGSRDEEPELSGVSHFLEHMMFKGTAKRTAEEVNRDLDEVGSQSNAYTSEEQTVYHAIVLPEYTERTVELLADMMRPALRDEDFETERQVILEEIAKYDDQPPFGAFERSMLLHYGQHSLGRSILGTRESVGSLRVAQMREFFHQQYSPGNMALVATGCVDFPRLVELAERYAGDWPSFEARRDPTRGGRVPSTPQFEVRPHPLATQQYVILTSDGPATDDPDRYAGRLLATILGDDSGSRLFWELVDTGLAECAAMGPHEYQGTGLILSYLCCEPEHAMGNLQLLHDVLREAEVGGVTEQELEQAQNKICAQIVLSSERSASRLFSVGGGWLSRGEYRTVADAMAAYRAVRLEDIRRVLERFPLTRYTCCAVGPLGELAPPS